MADGLTNQQNIQTFHGRDLLHIFDALPRLKLHHNQQVIVGVSIVLLPRLDTGECVGGVQGSVTTAAEGWVFAISHNALGIFL